MGLDAPSISMERMMFEVYICVRVGFWMGKYSSVKGSFIDVVQGRCDVVCPATAAFKEVWPPENRDTKVPYRSGCGTQCQRAENYSPRYHKSVNASPSKRMFNNLGLLHWAPDTMADL